MKQASFALLLMGVVAAPAGAQQPVKLTTLDWCPYTCVTAPDGGFSSVIVREAFKAMGYRAEIEFLPWQRAVATAKGSSEVAGYFPEYPAELDGFDLSSSIGTGPLGLIMRKGAPVPPPTADAIRTLKLGVVSGYVNAAPVAAAIAAGLKPEGVADDNTNIRKLAAGRIDAAEIDQFVFGHLLKTDARLADVKNDVVFAQPLEEKTLHVAFNKTAYGKKLAAVFAEGLAKVDIKSLQQKYFALAQ